jgi:formylglycine-generating enzyme required for sulfatase activity
MRTTVFALLLLAGCYSHARRDEPAPPPEDAAGPMVSIGGGLFTMGDNTGDPDEYPERKVSLSPYKIDRMEVTNEAYAMCVKAKACDPNEYMDDPDLGKEDHPVVGVTWEDALGFCKWIGRRLPTEAEWEFAAKGGDFRKWPWTGGFDPALANSNDRNDSYDKTAPVAEFEAGQSPFGALNMAGNAAEWVWDYFDPTYYRAGENNTQNPKGPSSGRERVVRGGSYRDPSHTARVAARRAKLPTESDNSIGFRCAKDD